MVFGDLNIKLKIQGRLNLLGIIKMTSKVKSYNKSGCNQNVRLFFKGRQQLFYENSEYSFPQKNSFVKISEKNGIIFCEGCMRRAVHQIEYCTTSPLYLSSLGSLSGAGMFNAPAHNYFARV